ncbi:MAG: hypothetical protein IJJ26_08390 [Victivallales bacterium]|nr:hypothetical protein [Victivallales bacterium]
MSTLWISHRGESSLAPENTVSAFRLARQSGSDGSECDIYLTSDHKIIVSHDNTTARMGDIPLPIEQSSFDQLRAVKIANWNPQFPNERLATLDEALDELGSQRIFYIELKGSNPELVPALRDNLAARNVSPSQIVLISFNADLLAACKELMPQYKTLFLMNFQNYPDFQILIDLLHKIHADGIDAHCAEFDGMADTFQQLHNEGFYIALWTVDTPGLAKRLIHAGADAITSNAASSLKKLLQA